MKCAQIFSNYHLVTPIVIILTSSQFTKEVEKLFPLLLVHQLINFPFSYEIQTSIYENCSRVRLNRGKNLLFHKTFFPLLNRKIKLLIMIIQKLMKMIIFPLSVEMRNRLNCLRLPFQFSLIREDYFMLSNLLYSCHMMLKKYLINFVFHTHAHSEAFMLLICSRD